MTAPKPLQLILARQLASSVAMPILLVDAEGTLIFYNEPAEGIFRQRFDETGEIPAHEWNRLVELVDEDRKPVPDDHRPMRSALLRRRPVSTTVWVRSGETPWRHIHATAFPLIAEDDRLLGALSIFWEI